MSERSENPILVSERSRESETQRIRRLKQEIRQKKGELRDALSGLEPEQREPAGDVAGLADVLVTSGLIALDHKWHARQVIARHLGERATDERFHIYPEDTLGEREQAPAQGDALRCEHGRLRLYCETCRTVAECVVEAAQRSMSPTAEPTEEPALSDRELHHIWRNAPVGSALDTAVRLLTEARTRLAALEEENGKLRRLEVRLEKGLAWVYSGGTSQAVTIGRLCDEHLDRSGSMLGRVRDHAARLRAEPGADEGEEG